MSPFLKMNHRKTVLLCWIPSERIADVIRSAEARAYFAEPAKTLDNPKPLPVTSDFSRKES